MQWYAGKCVTTGSPGDRITSFVAFSSFYGINTPTKIANFKLPTWCH